MKTAPRPLAEKRVSTHSAEAWRAQRCRIELSTVVPWLATHRSCGRKRALQVMELLRGHLVIW
jgi:hypothetical protein